MKYFITKTIYRQLKYKYMLQLKTVTKQHNN